MNAYVLIHAQKTAGMMHSRKDRLTADKHFAGFVLKKAYTAHLQCLFGQVCNKVSSHTQACTLTMYATNKQTTLQLI